MSEFKSEPTNRLIRANELTSNIRPLKWLVKPIIPECGLVEIVGASSSYKTFLTLDIMFCVSAGIPYHGLKTNRGTVVYISAEGNNAIGERLKALETLYNTTLYDFYVLPMPSNLTSRNEVEILSSEIIAIAPNGVAMICFDTLHRNSAGSDENSSKDFSIILEHIDKYLKPIAKIISWIHHTGLSDASSNRGRGTSSRYAACDTVLLVSKSKNHKCSATLECSKQKDYEPFDPLVFDLEAVSIGITDEDGNDIKSLIPIQV